MLKSPALTPSPNILKNYTGWFTDSNGQRLATTLDGANLRLGCLGHIHGDILESWLLSFSQLPALNIGGSSKEETALDHPFQAHAKAFPGGHTVSFDIKMGTVHGMTIDKVFYARDEPDKCIILSVPTEIRQMIWRHSVHSGASKLTLLQRGDRRIITDDMHTELNRIHEVHPAFATEALHLELCDPNTTLECTDAGHLVELLHSDKGNVKLSLCHVVLWTDWGQKPLLMPESHEQQHLYYILRYAAANKKVKFSIHLMNWGNQEPSLVGHVALRRVRTGCA